jgi:hypothetical protein
MFGGGARPNLKPLDWGVIAEHDKQRHERARQLLAAGKVETATEFSFIALLFQHSGQPDMAGCRDLRPLSIVDQTATDIRNAIAPE